MKTLNGLKRIAKKQELPKALEGIDHLWIPYIQERTKNEQGHYLVYVREGMAMIPYTHGEQGEQLAIDIRMMDAKDRTFVQGVRDYWNQCIGSLDESIAIYANSEGRKLQAEIVYDHDKKQNPSVILFEEKPEVVAELKGFGWTESKMNLYPVPGKYEFHIDSPKGSGLFGMHTDEETEKIWYDLLNVMEKHQISYVERQLTLADKM